MKGPEQETSDGARRDRRALWPRSGRPQPLREHLPDERQSITHKFRVGDQEGYLTVGLYADGRPGEIFVKINKEGSTVSGLMDAVAMLTSVTLQYGVPIEDLARKLKNTRFEPYGRTGNPRDPLGDLSRRLHLPLAGAQVRARATRHRAACGRRSARRADGPRLPGLRRGAGVPGRVPGVPLVRVQPVRLDERLLTWHSNRRLHGRILAAHCSKEFRMPEPALPLKTVDSVTITTLVDNYVDALLLDQGPAKRLGRPTSDTPHLQASILEEGQTADAPLAEHGFSVQISFKSGGRERRVLFDTGMTPSGLVDNARRLSLSIKDVEAIVLSHGHFDHTTGMDGLVRALGRPNLPVYLHPEAWSKRRLLLPGRDPFEVPTPSKSAIRGAGFEITEEKRPSFLFDGCLLITGEVDRTTEFEKGFPIHQAKRNGDWQPDPLILDDQAAILHVKDKGLVVLTGCGHAGIVNIVRYAQRLTGVDQLYAVIGGFHLNGPLFEPIIPAVCDALAAVTPEVIVPAHCTGWKAVHAIAARFPDAFIQNSVGTRFELGSA